MPSRNINARPTTDMAKESLINILNSGIGIEGKNCLDLFCGTGNISFELASQGAANITSVDVSNESVLFINKIFDTLRYSGSFVIKKNVFNWIKENHTIKYDIIFADPPYDIIEIETLPDLILNSDLVHDKSILIIEHRSNFNFIHSKLIKQRKYGQSSFSFFNY